MHPHAGSDRLASINHLPALSDRVSRLDSLACVKVVVGEGWNIPIFDTACLAARQPQRQRATKPLADFIHDQHSPSHSSIEYHLCILDTYPSIVDMTLSTSEPGNEPPGKPPAASHGSARPNPPNVDDSTPSLFEKVQSLKEEATKILEVMSPSHVAFVQLTLIF